MVAFKPHHLVDLEQIRGHSGPLGRVTLGPSSLGSMQGGKLPQSFRSFLPAVSALARDASLSSR